jgi:hypothetical protein
MADPITSAKKVAEKLSLDGCDVLLLNCGLDRPLDEQVIRMCHKRKCRPKLLLILITEGGDANAAYRIARCLQDRYEHFSCLISGYCKSAGTLVALGANELIFGEHGELGPLDVQMAKKDELWGSESGLTVLTALAAIHEKALLAFEHFFLSITRKSQGRISTRTSFDASVKLTEAIFSPITQQIAPLHVGEAWRSMAVATQYGYRLREKSRNFSLDTLETIVTEYPSHGFVIDQREAEGLFRRVRGCNDSERELLAALRDLATIPADTPRVEFLSGECSDENGSDISGHQPIDGQAEQHASSPS